MGRRKDVYRANRNTHRNVTTDRHGNLQFQISLLDGDAGRLVDVCLTAEQFESFSKEGREALQRHAIEQVRAEYRRHTSDLQLQFLDLQRQKKEFQRVIEQVREAVHPPDSAPPSLSDRFRVAVAPPPRPQ